MRDIAITLIVITGCLYSLKKPYIGVLLWSWLSYMNPHRLAYGFAYNMPFAQITAVVLITSMLFSKEKQKIPFTPITVTWISLILFMGVTTLFAYYKEQAMSQYINIIKIQLVVFLTMALITDFEKLRHLIWVIVISIGYFSVKGGFFTILTAGSHKVWGPEGSFIEDNNALAVAILMVISLMFFLYKTSNKKIIKNGLLIAIILSFFCVLGSQSRGAFLAITVVGFNFWLASNNKMFSGLIIALFSAVLLAFMPETWYKRMSTINTYEEDSSAMGRINAWEYAFNAANHNFLGMGLDNWSLETFAMYAPDPTYYQAAHSIYFSILGDHGWIGLFIYLLLFFLAYKKLNEIIKKTKQGLQLQQINILARMLKIGLIAYMVGGAFLSIAYFDLPWCFICMSILLEQFVNKSMLIKENGINNNPIKIRYV